MIVRSYYNGLSPQEFGHFGAFDIYYISSSAIVRIQTIELETNSRSEFERSLTKIL